MSDKKHPVNFAEHIRNYFILREKDQHPKDTDRAEERVEYKYGLILESFEVHGNFLDEIAFSDNPDSSNDMLMIVDWIIAYSISWMQLTYNEFSKEDDPDRVKRTEDPSKSIKRDIKIIQNFENLIKDRFDFMLKGNKLRQKYIKEDHKKLLTEREEKTELIENLLAGVESLKKDLEEKTFQLFMREEYYQMGTISKQNLGRILATLAKKYKLSNHTIDQKQLIDDIPLPEELSSHINRENVFQELAIYLPDLSTYYNIPDKFYKTPDKK